MLFKNSFSNIKDNGNTETHSLSGENIKKCIDRINRFNGDKRIEKANIKQQVSMINFSQWLRKQDDVSDAIKIISGHLTAGVPVHPEFAKQFEPFIERYNAFLRLKKRRRKK